MINENVSKSSDFQIIFNKIKSIIKELENLNDIIDTGNATTVIKKIYQLDS